MKRVATCLVVIGGLVAGVMTAQAEEKLRVGVMDVRKVLVESTQGQQSRTELEQMVKERREKIAKEENAVKALQESLEKNKLTLTDKQKEQKQKEFDGRVGALKKMAQEAQQEVAKRDNELSRKAGDLVQGLIADIAKQERLLMVIEKNQNSILWTDEPVDITERVLKAFEAKTGK